MILGEVLVKMVNSDRLIVTNSDKAELYRGYVANFRYSTADRNSEVKGIQLATEIFRKEKRTSRLIKESSPTIPVPLESISDFSFSDLEMLIYTRITLEE